MTSKRRSIREQFEEVKIKKERTRDEDILLLHIDFLESKLSHIGNLVRGSQEREKSQVNQCVRAALGQIWKPDQIRAHLLVVIHNKLRWRKNEPTMDDLWHHITSAAKRDMSDMPECSEWVMSLSDAEMDTMAKDLLTLWNSDNEFREKRS